MAPGAVEAVGTLTDIGPRAGASVQTHRRAKSLETERSEVVRGGVRAVRGQRTDGLTHRSRTTVRSSLVDTSICPETRNGRRCDSDGRTPLEEIIKSTRVSDRVGRWAKDVL